MTSIKNGKQLYHFTALGNLESILKQGLLSRSQLEHFEDVADPEILTDREKYKLDTMVPFHFFNSNPFDGRVCINNPDKKFVYIVIHRDTAKNNNWQIIPKHPLSGECELHTYVDGMNAIDWKVMDQRDFKDPISKCICMAECLSPNTVLPKDIFAIYTANDHDAKFVQTLKAKYKLKFHVDLVPDRFPKVYKGR
ncbi:TPA: DUF4433 domain-containing protein [Vibrio parahaemolyticus]|uniref:DarT ssDNA thymidine ADP-ribosyltransferase family protein n=1 Tax=Vibrio parahaemolyticus TaxID=670 RepID=UPI000A3C8D3C|nr:DarT ssDNA thymidine ADP-ribosyltransferase family protein [Vibrio parahaemolyticus]EHK7404364.1 DUF4433 domain-containing protein [Vibrio parahaemolyticus]MDF4625002.1 DarT ssDNA thymidine ADP-ribosyltransferase family protein [Vibrio parahaemolyticus]MDG2639194.1 DarT ssDNA thymidine ADP-ribosyltransferase family protein [Vibrio parahaemolyticus]OUJ42264.1 hypothetical protein BTZ05_10290 [Vibrio parahaemolyticus]HBC3457135.1 DUF4433 domain-containing protein [Vibrio parahaemolyticus]